MSSTGTGYEFWCGWIRRMGTNNKFKETSLESLWSWTKRDLWAQLRHAVLLENGYIQCHTNSCLHKKGGESVTTLVGVCLDDLLVTVISVKYVRQIIKDIFVLEGKDLGEVSMFLDIGITQDNKNGYHVEQPQSIRKILNKLHSEQTNWRVNLLARKKMMRIRVSYHQVVVSTRLSTPLSSYSIP